MALVAQFIAWLIVWLLVLVTNRLRLPVAWTIMAMAVTQGLLSAVIAWRLGAARWWFWIHLFFWPLIISALSLHWSPWLYLAAFLLLCLIYWSTFKTRVPFFLTNRQTGDALFTEIEAAKPGRLTDLGCASGHLLQRLASRFPDIEFTGFEIAPIPFVLAKWRLRKFPNVTVCYRDFWQIDLGDYDLVYAFLSDEPMSQLWEKACQEMRPGAIFISNTFAVPDVEPDRKVAVDDFRGTELLIWQMEVDDNQPNESDGEASSGEGLLPPLSEGG